MSVVSSFDLAHQNMIFGQLICNRIQNTALLNAMGNVPRERFVPDRLRGRAYADEPILIGGKTVLFSPSVFANLALLADIRPDDFVLNLHAGTGYSAAVLARMAHAVVALEEDSALCENAEKIYIDTEIDNVALFNRPSESGFPTQAPFDVVFIDGVVPQIPDAILNQLAEGGRLVAVLATPDDVDGKATKVVKCNGNIRYTRAFDVNLQVFERGQIRKKFVFEGIS